jgi:multidrug transporter EmrE-like cation transporter
MALLGEPVTAARIAGIAMITAGIVALKAAG